MEALRHRPDDEEGVIGRTRQSWFRACMSRGLLLVASWSSDFQTLRDFDLSSRLDRSGDVQPNGVSVGGAVDDVLQVVVFEVRVVDMPCPCRVFMGLVNDLLRQFAPVTYEGRTGDEVDDSSFLNSGRRTSSHRQRSDENSKDRSSRQRRSDSLHYLRDSVVLLSNRRLRERSPPDGAAILQTFAAWPENLPCANEPTNFEQDEVSVCQPMVECKDNDAHGPRRRPSSRHVRSMTGPLDAAERPSCRHTTILRRGIDKTQRHAYVV